MQPRPAGSVSSAGYASRDCWHSQEVPSATSRANGERACQREGGDGAGDGIRTRDILLGKQTLCQLSYSRSGATGTVVPCARNSTTEPPDLTTLVISRVPSSGRAPCRTSVGQRTGAGDGDKGDHTRARRDEPSPVRVGRHARGRGLRRARRAVPSRGPRLRWWAARARAVSWRETARRRPRQGGPPAPAGRRLALPRPLVPSVANPGT